jgi:hypothetical protein
MKKISLGAAALCAAILADLRLCYCICNLSPSVVAEVLCDD